MHPAAKTLSYYSHCHLSFVIGEKKQDKETLFNRSGLPAPSGLPKTFYYDYFRNLIFLCFSCISWTQKFDDRFRCSGV
jgi:hypothetical protein